MRSGLNRSDLLYETLRVQITAPTDTVVDANDFVVIRGGSWSYDIRTGASYSRTPINPSYRSDGLDFRLCYSL